MKTSELTGLALRWAVCVAEGNSPVLNPFRFGSISYGMFESELGYAIKSYDTDWSQVGPIIEREGVELNHNVIKPIVWCAWVKTWNTNYFKTKGMTGPTPLIAAMRCYVASKLGDEVEIPEELCLK